MNFVKLLLFYSMFFSMFSQANVNNKSNEMIFLKYNFSNLLKPKTDFLGFMEPNYQRLKITFSTVKKISKSTYLITGISDVKNKKCNFSGNIKVEKIEKSKNKNFEVDENYKKIGVKDQGVLIGSYEFKETKKQKNCGVFEGKMFLNWYIDKNGKIKSDDIEDFSDNFKNNQYEGTWSEYGNGIKKKANWGEHRIPSSGDLDIGAAEFSVNPKYLKNGWAK